MIKIPGDRVKILKSIYPFIKKSRGLYFSLVILKAFFLGFALITPLFYMMLINDVMINKNIGMLFWVILGYIGVYLLQTLGTVINKIVYNKLFIKFNLNLKYKILENYFKMNTKDYDKFNIGELKNRLENDSGVFEKFLMSHILDYSFSVISAIVISIILLSMNWILALVSFIMVPLSFVFTKVMGKKAVKVSNEYREKYGIFEGFMHSTFQNWKEIKSNNLESTETERLSQHWGKLSKLFVKNQILWYINRGFIAFKDLFITRMNLYFIGGLLIINGQMEVAVLLTFMSYYEQFFGNISSITNLILGLKQDKVIIDRVLEVINYPSTEKPKVKIIDNDISVKNISFKYLDTGKDVINNLSLNINKQEHIAIVGKSGCGKTTLAKLLIGLYQPHSGSITLGNYNIYEVSAESLNKKIGIVMQDPMLFNLTIKENLMFAKKRATQDEINEACKQANIFDFIQNLPDQYNTIIGERGVKLSGGQKQRLAIARAILFDPDIIIFDEATSSLDHESEKAILLSIKNLSQKKTIITIAHRLSSVLEANRVIVMDTGSIVAIDTHEKLIDKNEIYDLLFKNQYHVG